VIVAARKPDFFGSGSPLYEIADETLGLLRPAPAALTAGRVFHGGGAALVEEYLGVSGEDILYVGDHVHADVQVSKQMLRWRTALIVRELEDEIRAQAGFAPDQARLSELMAEKAAWEHESCRLQLSLQRSREGYGPAGDEPPKALEARLHEIRATVNGLDERIAPLARASSELGPSEWGPLMRAGNDKSLFARQVERDADVYTSRAANLLHATPFAFLRAPRTGLPHDRS